MAYLCGEFRHQIDEKGRIRIPAKLKVCLDADSVICRGQNCLYVFSGAEFSEMVNKFKTVPFSDVKAQDALRKFFASTYPLEEDGQGRSNIPSKLREDVKLTKNIVSVGVLNRIEIWDEEKFDLRNKGSENFDEIIEVLREYGV